MWFGFCCYNSIDTVIEHNQNFVLQDDKQAVAVAASYMSSQFYVLSVADWLNCRFGMLPPPPPPNFLMLFVAVLLHKSSFVIYHIIQSCS